MGLTERMRAQYSEADLDEIDRAVHAKIGHSHLSAHLAAPRYTRDIVASHELVKILTENIAWFNIDKLDTEIIKDQDGRYDGNEWEITLCNVRDMTVRGPTFQITVAKAVLLDGILKKLTKATVEVVEIDTMLSGGEDGEEEEG